MKANLSYDIGSALFRQLAAATRNGVALHEVTRILEQDPESVRYGRSVIAGLSAALGEGDLLSRAMQKSPMVFAAETVGWVQAAEKLDHLGPTLEALANDYELRERGRSDLRLALMWPACLSIGVVLLFAMLAIFVMPAFREFYASFGMPLPGLTEFTFSAAGYASGVWWLWLPLLVFVVGYLTRRLPVPVMAGANSLLNRIGFVRRFRVASFNSRLLNMLQVHCGQVELLGVSLAHLAATTEQSKLAGIALRLRAAVASGITLSGALAAEPLLPKRMALYLQLGEKMQDFSAPLAQLCDLAEIELSRTLAHFERGTIVLLYLLFGVAVGTLVISVYLPIFKLGSIV
jgi:type IV pilus assembly protein PilC